MGAKKVSTQKGVNTAIGICTVAVFFILLTSPVAAIDYMKKGLGLCATSVIPSLFPFMIVSELIVGCGIGQRLSKILAPLTRRLFGVGEAGACACLLGTLCGFPVGARSAATMYDRGDISARDLERILTLCNNPGPAFIISTVGAALLGRQDVGAVIYACVIVSAIAVGIFAGIFFKGTAKEEPKTDTATNEIEAKGLDAQIFTSSVRSSALSMLTVCAYVVFFYTLVGCIKGWLDTLGAPAVLSALLFGFFELSSGAASACELKGVLLPAVACALFSGWSGLSVHFQIISVTAGRGVSYKPYLLSKAVQGILCAALCAVTLKFIFPSLLSEEAGAFPAVNPLLSLDRGVIICTSFGVAALCVIIVGMWQRKKKYHRKISLTKPRLCDTIHCNIKTR